MGEVITPAANGIQRSLPGHFMTETVAPVFTSGEFSLAGCCYGLTAVPVLVIPKLSLSDPWLSLVIPRLSLTIPCLCLMDAKLSLSVLWLSLIVPKLTLTASRPGATWLHLRGAAGMCLKSSAALVWEAAKWSVCSLPDLAAACTHA